MLCEEPPANGCNFAVGEVIHIAYLGDLSVYHVRLKSGQMISAQLQNAHRHRKGDAPRDKCTLSCAINGIHAAFHYLKKNYISGCVMTVPTGW